MSEYEAGRHEGVRRALEAARATVGSIAKRKREAARGPIDDATFQYASGLVNGAREVLRGLEELDEELRLHDVRAESARTTEVVHDQGATLTLGVVHFEPRAAWYWGDLGTCRACGAVSATAGQQAACPTCGFRGV